MLLVSIRHWLLVLSSISFVAAQQNTTDYDQWINPNGAAGDFAQTYTNERYITLSWKELNNSRSDLWITSYDSNTNSFAKVIGLNIDISQAGTFRWGIALAGVVIEEDDRFVLRFIPHQIPYYSGLTDQFASPGFIIQRLVDATGAAASSTTASSSFPSSTTSASHSTASALSSSSTAVSSQTTIQTSSPTQGVSASSSTAGTDTKVSKNGLSGGAIAGIVIGSIVGVALFVFLGWFIGSRHRRQDPVRSTEEKLVPPSTDHSGRETQYSYYASEKSIPPDTTRDIQQNSRPPVELDAGNVRTSRHEVEGSTPISSESIVSPRSASSYSSPHQELGTI